MFVCSDWHSELWVVSADRDATEECLVGKQHQFLLPCDMEGLLSGSHISLWPLPGTNATQLMGNITYDSCPIDKLQAPIAVLEEWGGPFLWPLKDCKEPVQGATASSLNLSHSPIMSHSLGYSGKLCLQSENPLLCIIGGRGGGGLTPHQLLLKKTTLPCSLHIYMEIGEGDVP